MTCPKCKAEVSANEVFCPACGAKVGASVEESIAHDRAAAASDKARKWLLACAILTAISGVVFFFMQRNEIEDNIHGLDRAVAGMDPGRRDELLREKTGMGYDEIVRHDRGLVNMLLFVNGGLAALYLGMWWWAKRNVVGAALVSLIVLISVHAVSAVFDPKTLAQGIIFKVIFIGALVGALQAALESRRYRKAAAPT